MQHKPLGLVWSSILVVILVFAGWLDDQFFQSGIREWLPGFINSAQTVLGIVGLALGLAYTVYMELQDQKLRDFGPDHVGTRAVGESMETKPLWKRIL